MQLAPSIHARTDDSNGALGDVLRSAVAQLATISPRLTIKPTLLAERILEAVAEAGYGEFDGIIPGMAEALGAEGLDRLKQITNAWASIAPTPQEIAQFRQFGLSTSPVDHARRQRQGTASIILADIADLQGDADAYMARYPAEQLTCGTIAPDVARRLIDVGGWTNTLSSFSAPAPPKQKNPSAHPAINWMRSTRIACKSWVSLPR